MIANQTSRGLRRVACQNAARWIGLLGSSLALLAACGGTIEQTDLDREHLQDDSNGKQQAKAPEAAATPAKTTPAASNQTAAAPAATTPKPAAAEPPPAADDEDPPAAEDDPPASTTTTASADLSFESDIWPIFSKSCSPCHAGGGAGGQDIGGSDKTKALADAKSFKDAIIRDINSGAMPLGCAKPPGGGGNCVSVDDFDDIKAWFDAGAPK
jgi:hypothetical protein